MVECLTQDLGVAGSNLTGVTVLCSCVRHIDPCLVLVQPRKTLPHMAEKFLTGTLRIKSIKPSVSDDICHLLIALANSLGVDQA